MPLALVGFALQRFRTQPLRSSAFPPRSRLSWNWLPVQSSLPGEYRGYWFRDPIPPLAFPRPYGFPTPGISGTSSKDPPHPLFGFHLPPEFAPVAPSQRLAGGTAPAPSHGLLLPSAHPGLGGPLPRVCLTRYVPPSGFGHPLGGFLPPDPRRPCFVPAALLGFRPSELSPLERCP
jgi:hypothetical protein